MSYLGYTNMISEYCSSVYFENRRPVRILEIGVDKGQTALPLLSNLTTLGVDFMFVGVDVLKNETFETQIQYMEGVRPALWTNEGQSSEHRRPNYFYTIRNSLEFLPELVQNNVKFDCILLDGDHNYATVSEELKYFNGLTERHVMCFADDYNGKHAGKDSFYSENDEYQQIKDMFIELDNNKNKQGVNTAIDEFIEKNNEWNMFNPMPHFEPVIMVKNMTLDEKNMSLTKV